MLGDESTNPGRRPVSALNVLGELLEICSVGPMTGFYRDGCCNTGREDAGMPLAKSETGHLNKTRSIWRPALTKLLKVSENPVGKP